MKRGVSSGQGTAALVKSATISTSLSGPVHADRLCQKGRVTSLHNHKGHRHVRVRRGSIHTLKTWRCKKKFTACEIFSRRVSLPRHGRTLQRRATTARAGSIRCRNERRASALATGKARQRQQDKAWPRRRAFLRIDVGRSSSE